MMVSRGLFGWSPPHIQPLTPVSEVSEPPESPSPYLEQSNDAGAEDDQEIEDVEETEQPPAAVPFSRLFACADRLDWVLMIVGSVAAAAHGAALVIYLHFFGKVIQLSSYRNPDEADELFHKFNQVVSNPIQLFSYVQITFADRSIYCLADSHMFRMVFLLTNIGKDKNENEH